MISETNPVIKDDLLGIATADLPWHTLRDKTIMVTGGGGFLAAYLIKSLITVGRLNNYNIKIVCVARNLRSVQARLSDYVGAREFAVVVHDISRPLPPDIPHVDIVIHSASQASPKYYGTDPVGTLLPNTAGTMYLLDQAVRTGVERFMFFSSAEIYGVPLRADQLLGEDDYGYIDPMNVRSCYAESKRMGETMCVAWARQHGIHTSVVRPFHTYGPGMALDDGRVFADLVADVVSRRDIVLKSDGKAIRSFCYISDATVAFLTVLLRGAQSTAYNVGNPGAELSISELAELVARLFPERGIGVKYAIRQDGDNYLKSPVSRSSPSVNSLKALGWTPGVGAEVGFRRTISSFL